MSRIALDRWEAAQTAEFGHHQDLRLEAYITATNVIGKYLGIDYEEDFKDKVIVQVGAGPRGSILSTKGAFKRGIVVEPLIDRWPSNIREDYEEVGVEIIAAPYEDLEIDEKVDETWFFNVVQHVFDPKEQLELAKKTSKVIRVFEPIGTSTDTAHPHYITEETFTDVLGNFGQIFEGGTEQGFFSCDCYYGTWYETDNV
jgi:hypothetical protein|tara:strand:- start:59 stop:658 length:600 start_codon:yes stop_codon:yes gene_type:complete